VVKSGGWQDFTVPRQAKRYLKVKMLANYEDVVWIDVFEFRVTNGSQETRP
jgi:hypothetical protein